MTCIVRLSRSAFLHNKPLRDALVRVAADNLENAAQTVDIRMSENATDLYVAYSSEMAAAVHNPSEIEGFIFLSQYDRPVVFRGENWPVVLWSMGGVRRSSSGRKVGSLLLEQVQTDLLEEQRARGDSKPIMVWARLSFPFAPAVLQRLWTEAFPRPDGSCPPEGIQLMEALESAGLPVRFVRPDCGTDATGAPRSRFILRTVGFKYLPAEIERLRTALEEHPECRHARLGVDVATEALLMVGWIASEPVRSRL